MSNRCARCITTRPTYFFPKLLMGLLFNPLHGKDRCAAPDRRAPILRLSLESLTNPHGGSTMWMGAGGVERRNRE